MGKSWSEGTQQMSVRLPVPLLAWVKSQAEETGISISDQVRGYVEDARYLFGLPRLIVDTLEADMKALGMSTREYLMHLVTLRYDEVKARGPGFEKAKQKPR